MLYTLVLARGFTYQRCGLQNKFKLMLSPEMALELPSGADFGRNRHRKASPVDLEGSRGQVFVVLGGFRNVLGGNINFPLWPKAGSVYQ